METPYNNCLQTEQGTERDSAHELICLMNTCIHLFSSTGLCFSWKYPCIGVQYSMLYVTGSDKHLVNGQSPFCGGHYPRTFPLKQVPLTSNSLVI